MPATLSISFEGAARTVTGSRHLLRFGAHSWLFDCGLYQGHREEADRVNRTFAFAPAEVEAVVVSHAHLDHTGNLPTLVSQGFRGEGAPPQLTDEVRIEAARRYISAYEIITGKPLVASDAPIEQRIRSALGLAG